MGEPATSKPPPVGEPTAGEPSCLIYLNGEERKVQQGSTISLLLAELKLAEDEVAVEMNRRIVRRPDWQSTEIQSGAAIEVVHFVGGG
jgi:thiamine biosynthesis protein ThiS